MPTNRSIHFKAGLTALLVTFLWSSSWVLVRWGLDGQSLDPLTFAALRYGLAALVLSAWVLARPQLRSQLAGIDRANVGGILVLGVVFYALTQGAQFVAIDNQPAATTSLVLTFTPLLVGLIAGRTIGERPTGRQKVGTTLVVAGAWLYFVGALGATWVGMVAAVIALLANTMSALIGRHMNRQARLSPVVLTAASMTVGAVLLAAAGGVIEGPPVMSPAAWLIVGWLAVVNTALAFTLWNLSLKHLSALESAAINNTMLIQIALLAWLFLNESLDFQQLAGIVLVAGGVLLTQIPGDTRRQSRVGSTRMTS